MRGSLVALVVGVMLFWASNGIAASGFSCRDLDDFASSLDEVAGYLEQIPTIVEGDEVDGALGEIVDGLNAISQVEPDRQLRKSVQNVEAAWEYMDRDLLMRSLYDCIDALDRIYDRDC